jgi:hypothetical protein
MKKYIIFSLLSVTLLLNSCGIYKPVDARKIPNTAEERARKNIEEGRGISINSLVKGRNREFEFSSSNPLWRASLEILDFLPLNTVDYSGGLIITDWYSDNQKQNEYIKITIRFLDNEIKADSLKIIVHQKICNKDNNCSTKIIKSNLSEELNYSILKTAAILDKNPKK